MSRWLAVVIALAVAAWPLAAEGPKAGSSASPGAEQAFTRAAPGRKLSFPRDHGSHPGYQTEWWYYTGQLWLGEGRPFMEASDLGFQLTFFRREERGRGSLGWSQSYLAHAALSDFAGSSYRAESRFARGGLSVAGASESHLAAWNHEWRAEAIGGAQVLELELGEGEEKATLKLLARPAGEPILHGDGGFSRKAACLDAAAECAGYASHYYSFPRLSLEGQLERNGKIEPVRGLGWMDHEFMSNALTPNQEGWDWMSLMLADGRDLMLFKLRSKGGVTDFASGSLIENGAVRSLTSADFTIEELSRWRSPHSGANYPSRWRVTVPAAAIDLELLPRLADQEVHGEGGPTYWEGAVGSGEGKAIGYVEMTGYHRAVGDEL